MQRDIWIMGISGLGDRFHDNSVCLVKNGRIIFAGSEERYSRVKHDPHFPEKAMKAAIDYAGIKRLQIKTYVSGWPKLSIVSNVLKLDWQDIFSSGLFLLKQCLAQGSLGDLVKVVVQAVKPVRQCLPMQKHQFMDHYLAHAASAYRTAGYQDCLAVVWDGFGTKNDGSLASGGVFLCQDGKILEKEKHSLATSLGLFYEAVTNALGFTPAEGEGKTMGLAAYGNPSRFLSKLKLFAPYFDNGKWHKSRHWPDTLFSVDLQYKKLFDATYTGKILADLISRSKEDVAAACQKIIEDEAVKYFKYLYKKYGMVCYATAGGVFLNVKMGKKIRELPFVKGFFVHPHAGDGGLALGAALEFYAGNFADGQEMDSALASAALGDQYSDRKIRRLLQKTQQVEFIQPKSIVRQVAVQLTKGKVIGWFQGQAEWGPRALGQRSVLADPRKPAIKERINKHLKKRDWFMPFAPSILEEKTKELIVEAEPCSFMTKAYDVTLKGKKAIAAAIHVDGTCRPQTVNKKTNPLYWQVIKEFEKLTGVPAVLNTSFNRHGLPIVNSPKDAVDHLLWGAVDELAIGSFLVRLKKSRKR